MINPTEAMQKAVKKALAGMYPQLNEQEIDISLEIPPNPDMGDFGIGLFSIVKKLKKSPVQIINEFIAKKHEIPYVKEFKQVGPYLNVLLDTPVFLKDSIDMILQAGSNFGNGDAGKGKKILIEYSAPNTNKPQHLGHVRNNVLGLSIGNIMKKAGYEVIPVNLVNDRGIHICKSMLAYKKWGDGVTPGTEKLKGDHLVGDFYVKFEKALKEDSSLLDEAQEMLVQWENGDPEVRQLWETMNGWVLEGFKETYDRMGCRFEKIYRESDTYKLGKNIVLKAFSENLCEKSGKGETSIDLTDAGLERKVLLRADGTSVYITQDLGTTVLKFDDFQPDRSVWIVASEQKYHFQVLFETLKKFGYGWSGKCYHMPYGMVYLPQGRMKTREGKVVDADALMDEMKDIARHEMEIRDRPFSGEELEETAERVGLSAIYYFLLKVHPLKDLTFNPEESISFDGATGPYLQYTHARICSVLRDAPEYTESDPDFSVLDKTEEIDLVKLLIEFPNMVEQSAEGLNPSKIASYIYDTGRIFNKFYNQFSILNAETKELVTARVALAKAVRIVLSEGLNLLGIYAPKRM